jgi:CBS domain-containing protein
MGTVRNILESKPKEIFTINPDTIVYRALEIMHDKNISSLVVVEGERLAGIFTERDYARKVILQGRASKETKIAEIMTEKLVTVTPESGIEECMQLMTTHHIRHLPVVIDQKLIGIISIGDVVKYIIEEQKYIIKNLEHYITRG